jgi:hypothetical protein
VVAGIGAVGITAGAVVVALTGAGHAFLLNAATLGLLVYVWLLRQRTDK